MNLSDVRCIATDGDAETYGFSGSPLWFDGIREFRYEVYGHEGAFYLGHNYEDICPPGHMLTVIAGPMGLQPLGEPIDMRPQPPAPPPTLWGRLVGFMKGGGR